MRRGGTSTCWEHAQGFQKFVIKVDSPRVLNADRVVVVLSFWVPPTLVLLAHFRAQGCWWLRHFGMARPLHEPGVCA